MKSKSENPAALGLDPGPRFGERRILFCDIDVTSSANYFSTCITVRRCLARDRAT